MKREREADQDGAVPTTGNGGGMKIVGATIQDFKRIEVVEILPGDGPVEVSGRNEQGKSSILDAIESALGGKRRQPEKPIRRGAESARVVLTLDGVIVERVWTEKTDRLVVKNADGYFASEPQRRLDELVGGLAFDPLAFMAEKPGDQRATLLRLVGVDLDAIEMRRRAVYEERTEDGRELRHAKERLLAAPEPSAGTPEEEVDSRAISAELFAAHRRHAEAHDAERAVGLAGKRLGEAAAKIERMKADLSAAQQAMKEVRVAGMAAAVAETKAKADLPDLDKIQVRLDGIEQTNRAVRQRQERWALAEMVDSCQARWDAKTRDLEAIDLEKAQALFRATMPVEGLAVTDDGLMFEGLPLSQASLSRRVRICTKISAALNPKLRIALIRNGNDLDRETLAAFYAECAAAGVQPWVERIDPTTPGALIIEAGRVAAKRGDR